MTKNSVLVLITSSFPYSYAKEDTFLIAEISHLVSSFQKVIIIPQRVEGKVVDVPRSVEINTNFAVKRSIQTHTYLFLLAIMSAIFWKEIIQRPQTLLQPQVLLRVIHATGHVSRTKWWMRTFLKGIGAEANQTVLYTYWLSSVTLGVGLLKNEFPNLRLVSRAHGGDLYDYRYAPPYIPLQEKILKAIDHLFLISEDGMRYIISRYPWLHDRCEVSRLAVRNPGFLSFPSTDGAFRIVSCAYLTNVKRIDLLAKGLICLAEMCPGQRFEWSHIGDGPLLEEITSLTSSAPENLSIKMLGTMTNEAVYQKYRQEPVDLFVNTSASEGISVAIMEAVSCGIPVLATDVGGTKEIVTPENGFLIPGSIDRVQLAEHLLEVLQDRHVLADKRLNSIQIWKERFDADANFSSFVSKLKDLIPNN